MSSRTKCERLVQCWEPGLCEARRSSASRRWGVGFRLLRLYWTFWDSLSWIGSLVLRPSAGLGTWGAQTGLLLWFIDGPIGLVQATVGGLHVYAALVANVKELLARNWTVELQHTNREGMQALICWPRWERFRQRGW